VRAPENIARVEEVLTLTPRKSVKRLSQQLDLKQTPTLIIVRQDLRMFPYKIQMQESMNDVGKESRLVLCNYYANIWKTTQYFIRHILFCDDAHFHLNGIQTTRVHGALRILTQSWREMRLCIVMGRARYFGC
jgi:hypothetical protein